MDKNTETAFFHDEFLLRRTVYSINKAITEDAPYERREHFLETNNRQKYAPGDYINDNLRHYVVTDGVELISFNRGYNWEKRILVDHNNRITYSISRIETLKKATRRHGITPYFLQSILYTENGGIEGSSEQITLSDYVEGMDNESFTAEEFEKDYNNIMHGTIKQADGYLHYIITYSATRFEVKDIKLLLLDKDYSVIDSCSLMHYLTPDFASLTAPEYTIKTVADNIGKQSLKPSLLKIKPGVKPDLRVFEDQA